MDDPEALIEEARERQRRRRIRFALVLLIAAIGGGIGYGVDRGVSGGSPGLLCGPSACVRLMNGNRVVARSGPLYGFSFADAAPSSLSRLSLETLKRVGKSLSVPEGFSPSAVSPDGRHLVLLDSGEASLSIVDLTKMRIERAIQPRLDAALAGSRVIADAWPTADELFVVVQGSVSERVLAINPSTGAIRWRRSLGSTRPPSPAVEAPFVEAETVGSSLVMLTSSRGPQVRQVRVVVVSAGGRLRSNIVALATGGYRRRTTTFTVGPDGIRNHHTTLGGRSFEAQLVVTSGVSPHAYLLTGGGDVYSINPATAQASLHTVRTPSGAPLTSPSDLDLHGAALGENLVVASFFPAPGGAPRAGLYLIDPSTWVARLLDPTTPEWFTTPSSLITFTNAGQFSLPASRQTKGTGIKIYDTNGVLRHHLYGTQAFQGIEPTPLFTAAILPSARPPRSTLPQTPAQQRAYDASVKSQELLFDPSTARSLGSRTATGQTPFLIQPHNDRAYR